MTDNTLAQLSAVNTFCNTAPYRLDDPTELPDTWKCEPDEKGWLCRDYALAKADILRHSYNFPPSDLYIILCYDELGEYHAVLAAVLDSNTWILDNRYPSVYNLNAPPYTYDWAYRQAPGGTEFVPFEADGV